MKKLFFVCTSVIMMIACTGTPTKVEESENCNCVICEACDSLLENGYTDTGIMWYDSLTTLVVWDLEYHKLSESRSEFINYIVEEYAYNPKIMEALHEGWDGLCGDVYLQHSDVIDTFYDVIEIVHRNDACPM